MTTTALIRSFCLHKNSLVQIVGCNLRLYARSEGIQCVQLRSAATKADVEDALQKYRKGDFEKLPNPDALPHFKKKTGETLKEGGENVLKQEPLPMGAVALPHPIWTEAELHSVQITHKPPEGIVDKLAYYTVQTMRKTFDTISGFRWGERNEYKWLKRIIFLETVAGVPGMVAAMTRHLHSLRRLQRDYGWIHTLLEEAENERMHLMTALQLKQPSRLFRLGVVCTQGVFVGTFSIWYLISPRFCHRFVGYLEEEAVKTYTKCLQDIEEGSMQHWKTQPSPEVAIRYWNLPENATMKDVILAIRADEAHHRIVNHTLASMKPTDYNPYKPGQ